jgi:sugar/nucleoside kinase (ribokinase family)
MPLNIKPKERREWNAAALGEVMLRLDPGEGRIRTTREFRVWEGGGEYNVVRGLRRRFGLLTTVVTAIVDSEVGHLLEDLMLQGGVDLSHVQWAPFDGVGRAARVGLNVTESGCGARAIEVNRRIASLVDMMIGNEEDFTAALGLEVPGMDEHISHLDPASFRRMIAEACRMYPNFQAVATTLRNAKTASVNDWGAGKSPQQAVECGAAHGALAMITPGDTSMATCKEVEAVMNCKGARVIR